MIKSHQMITHAFSLTQLLMLLWNATTLHPYFKHDQRQALALTCVTSTHTCCRSHTKCNSLEKGKTN